ncbi:MAG: diaminopimelate decarboxylase family protein, partial [Chitinophagaceae bacterium]
MPKNIDVLSSDYLVKLAQEFGTPLYVYHAEKIERQYHRLQQAFGDAKARFFYACKALTNVNILKLMNQLGSGLDTVSIQEVKLGLKAGFDPANIIFTPNCVDLDEIIEAKELGVHINIDNISILEQFGNQFGGSYPVCIRLNPHIMAGGNFKISTGHVDSKFGIS